MSENVVLGFTNPDYENIRVLNRLGGTGDLFVAHKKGMNIDVVIKRTQLQYQHIMNQENESSILKSLKHQYLPAHLSIWHWASRFPMAAFTP